MIVETELKKQREETKQQFNELRKLITSRGIVSQWVKQDVACEMLNIKVRHLRNLRKHLDKNNNMVGYIGWRKGRGRVSIEYLKADIEKYLNHVVIR